ncbi:MAG: tyrosine-type recombinase/integrase [Deltaproteobacteria bacterium]|nr:tyrosine-type recombinase/integrase [Deltaproteobacteria bacterium]
MKPFESFMAPRLDEFLVYREGLGYKMKGFTSQLRAFDRYLKEKESKEKLLGPSFFLEMRANLNMQPSSVNTLLSAARVFFEYMVRCGYYKQNPLGDIPQLKKNTIVPFVFSPEQTDQLLSGVCKRFHHTKGLFLRNLAIYVAILLMARCGLRISEPLRLKRHHYRRDDGTIYIEKTKFNKDRLIPVPAAVMTQIDNYISVRKALMRRDESPYLLVRENQQPLTDFQVRRLFIKALKDIGLDQPRRVVGNVNFPQPTPHSLRHSFAVATLLRIKQRGESAQNALPVLAAYMGHCEYKYTSVYLRVTDALSRKQLVDFTLWQERKE